MSGCVRYHLVYQDSQLVDMMLASSRLTSCWLKCFLISFSLSLNYSGDCDKDEHVSYHSWLFECIFFIKNVVSHINFIWIQYNASLCLQCAWGLVCWYREAGAVVPGCTGEGPSEISYCVQDPSGQASDSDNNANGAIVVSVNVEPTEEGQSIAAAESENSSAPAASLLLATAMASTTVFMGLI